MKIRYSPFAANQILAAGITSSIARFTFIVNNWPAPNW